MEFKRLTNKNDEFFADAIGLYERAFPSVERRDAEDHALALEKSDYKCNAIIENGAFVGIAFFWESAEFIYLEHLAIVESLRGKGCGKRALAVLKELGKPVILEIEPPDIDETTAARRRFYESEGFLYNDIDHVQLHYRPDDDDCMLKPMSYPHLLSRDGYARFNAYLHACVTSYDRD